jgi:hypothetical protein
MGTFQVRALEIVEEAVLRANKQIESAIAIPIDAHRRHVVAAEIPFTSGPRKVITGVS